MVHPIHCQTILVHSFIDSPFSPSYSLLVHPSPSYSLLVHPSPFIASASQSIHGQSILVKSIRFINSPFSFFLVLSSPFYSFLVLSSPFQSFLVLSTPSQSFLVLSLSQSFIVHSFSTKVLSSPLSLLVRPSPSYSFIILPSPFLSGHSPFLFVQSLFKSFLQFFNSFHCQSFLLLPGQSEPINLISVS